jgi:uncharacterized protein (DUF58 family)
VKWKRRKKTKGETAGDRWLPRRIKTTREGKFLITFTIGLGFAAINTGNNLLYLVLGMLLSLIVVSGVLSELTLRDVVVERVFHHAIHAGRSTFMEYRLHNMKRRFSSFSVEVEEVFLDPDVAVQRPAYALVIRPGERRTATLRVTFQKRGAHESAGMRLATRYPFGFFRKWRFLRRPIEMVAFPSLHDVVPPRLSYRAQGHEDQQQRVGRGDEYHAIHDYLPGDDPRDIHWKSSARMRRVMTREYEASAEHRVTVMVPNVLSTEGASEPAEAAISEAASLVASYSRTGWAVGIQTTEGRLRPGQGPAHLRSIFGHLARVSLRDPDDAPNDEKKSELHPVSEDGSVLVLHPDQTVPAAWAGISQVHQCSVASDVEEGHEHAL